MADMHADARAAAAPRCENCTSLTVAMATPQHAPARAHARRPVTRFP